MNSKYNRFPRVGLTAQVSLTFGEEFDRTAESLGLTRHRLLILVIKAGFPLVVSQLGDKAHQSNTTTAQPQR